MSTGAYLGLGEKINTFFKGTEACKRLKKNICLAAQIMAMSSLLLFSPC